MTGFEPLYPQLDDLLRSMGEAGQRLSEIGASEGAAGNLSLCVRRPLKIDSRFPRSEAIELPVIVPELAGAHLLVTGSGQRLRQILDDPAGAMACITVDAGGKTGRLFTSEGRRFRTVTSEFNSHLAVYADQVGRTRAVYLALVHAQPIHLTYLSHLARYQNEVELNERLMRWQPETILNLPEGIGFIPFHPPGSAELMAGNVEALREHRIAVWAKHGVMACSDDSIMRATDLVEYAEAAATYEYLDLRAGGTAQRLSAEEIRLICKAYNVRQTLF
jgi:rhamnulose-1-phosphate aldolase